MQSSIVTKDLENNTLLIERSFNAQKEKVWQAYANKAWFERWWGPEGWVTSTTIFDFRPSGKTHYGMKCVDQNQGEWFGKESWGIMEIEMVEENVSFSAKDYFSNPEGTIDTAMPGQRFIIELVEEEGKTRLISKSITDSVEQIEELIKMGMVQGFDSQLNKLEALLHNE